MARDPAITQILNQICDIFPDFLLLLLFLVSEHAIFAANSNFPCYDDSTLSLSILPLQVVSMHILYVTTMIAVFALCIALFTTARRILRASPLQSGELSLPGLDGFANDFDVADSVRERRPDPEEAVFSTPHPAMSAEGLIEKIKAADQQNVPTIRESIFAEDADAMEDASREIHSQAKDTFAKGPKEVHPETVNTLPARKSSTPAYKYALEVLLIGVSVAVLVRTQRSTARFRVPKSSRDRVA
jgi:hypothetical protein